VEEAQQSLENNLQLQEEHQRLQGRADGFRQTLDYLRQALAETTVALSGNRRNACDLLEIVRQTAQVFHWNEMPKYVAQAHLDRIVASINQTLQLFGSPFYVSADADLKFLVHLPGKPPMSTSQLSGGQKVVLAVAFRTAVGNVFGHDIGMMFLDEPTAGLDADNVAYFQDAIQQLSQRLQADSQLVIITHSRSMLNIFDQVLEIGRS
jgi:exonuclease SbcC